MKRAGLIGMAALLAASVGVVASAEGKTTRVASVVDQDGYAYPEENTYQFVGNVWSPKARCERRRKVTVYYEQPGGTSVVDSDTTNRTGDWEVTVHLLGDTAYYAKVGRKEITRDGNTIVCKADRSPDFDRPPNV